MHGLLKKLNRNRFVRSETFSKPHAINPVIFAPQFRTILRRQFILHNAILSTAALKRAMEW